MESKSRSFLIIESLQSPLTGSKIRARAISEHIAKEGNVAFLLEPTERGSKENFFLRGVTVLRSDFPSWKMNLGFLKAIVSNISLSRRVREVDYVFAMKPLPTSCLPAILKRGKKTKIILDIDDLEYAYWENSKILSRILKIFERWAVKHFDYVTVHNPSLEKYVQNELGYPKNRIIYLPQGLDLSKYSKNKIPSEFELKGKKVLVYAAFLGIAANLHPIFKAYQELKGEIPSLVLIIIGGGPKLEEYREYSRKNNLGVIFTGYKDHQESLNIISRADVALNYMEDNFANKFRSPIKIREYLALGRKVASNNVGDTHLFRRYVYLSSNDLKDFKMKIKKALNSRKSVKPGKEYVYKNYDWNNIIKQFLKRIGNEKDIAN